MEYWLDVGSSPGAFDYVRTSVGTSLSLAASGLPTNGSTIYARLWTKTASGWGSNYNEYTYTAATPSP